MSTKDCIDKIGLNAEDKKLLRDAPDKADILDQAKKDIIRKKKNLAKQKQIHEKNMGVIFNHPNGVVEGLRSLLAKDTRGFAPYSNIEYRTSAIKGQASGNMAEVYRDLSNRMFGLKKGDEDLADDVIRELMGTPTNNKHAQKLAKQWSDVAEDLRVRFNEAGGDIGKLDGWGLPQSHEQYKVLKAGEKAWITYVTPRLMNADELDLPKIYDTIITGGLNKVGDVTPSGGGKMLANKRADARSLHFKDGDTWLEYNKKFGSSSDPLTIMDNHIQSMSMDIANLQIMGPNPKNLFQTLDMETMNAVRLAEIRVKEAKAKGEKPSQKDLLNSQLTNDDFNERIFNVVSGYVDTTVAGTTLARGTEAAMATLRATQTATKLGNATLSSITDLSSLMAQVENHGLSRSSTVKTLVKNLLPIKGLDAQVQTARLGFAADIFNSTLSRRFDEVDNSIVGKAADMVMRASGMSWWTEGLRKTFQYEYYNHLSNLQNKAVRTDQLPDTYKKAGFTLDEVKGLDFDNLTSDQQIKLLEMVNVETDFAVLMPGARTRAQTTGGGQRGDVHTELRKTAYQFKSFPVTFMLQHGGRVLFDGSMSKMSRAKYAAIVFSMSTLLGSVAMESKDASKGYEGFRKGSPFDEDAEWEDVAKYWLAAGLQGGGLGLLGDFFFDPNNTRYGNSPVPSLLGPSASTAERVYDLTVGNVHKAAAGEETSIANDAWNVVNRDLNPLNIWYMKVLFMNHVDQFMQELTDDNYDMAQQRKDNKRYKEYGQERGETLLEKIGF